MADTVVLNADGTLNEDFVAQLTDLISGLIETEEVQYSQVVKEYVEGQLSALENKLLNNEEWTKVKENIDALLKVFDADTDGSLTPEEVLAKFGELKASLDRNTADIATLSQKLEDNVKDLTAKIAANEASIAAVKDSVAQLQSDIDAKVAEAKDAASTLVDAVKTELGGQIDTVSGQVTQVSTKVEDIDAIVQGTVTAVAGIAEAFQAAAQKVEDRLAKVKDIFGLANDVADTAANIDGDGAVV